MNEECEMSLVESGSLHQSSLCVSMRFVRCIGFALYYLTELWRLLIKSYVMAILL